VDDKEGFTPLEWSANCSYLRILLSELSNQLKLISINPIQIVMARHRSCVFDQPRRKKPRNSSNVAQLLIESDRLEEASRSVQYPEDFSNPDQNPFQDPEDEEEDSDENEQDESTTAHKISMPNGATNSTSNDLPTNPLLQSIFDYHRQVRQQTRADRALKNWDELNPKLHGAYVWLKDQTQNWSNDKSFDDFLEYFCQCSAHSTSTRPVDLVDLTCE
jgi:hypothetical protein